MDYYEIGQKIRKYRKEKGLSQEQLAEAVNISVTHMSHIETANTKLSLPVLVDIAKTLQVSTDSLLFRHTFRQENTVNELLQVLSACTPQQIKLVCELAKTVKNTEG
ncbi:MAG: helix-turn-helix transcriptional regulator [Oscillospiraceae bacterium]|nr:helix-turn-helix transcriptional regulator [Oscillospiraceae bacterium]